ncbi:MAG: hypothetical protein QXR76_03385 [Candidatus Bathyarchaeia archaeon]
MSKIVSFRIGKGKTAKVPESEMDFVRKYLELEIRLPEQFTEEGFHEALLRASLLRREQYLYLFHSFFRFTPS